MPSANRDRTSALNDLYKSMSTADIKKRITRGELLPDALAMAQQELANRETTLDSATAEAIVPAWQMICALVLVGIAALVASYYFFPHLFFFVCLMQSVIAAIFLGKLFPKIATVVAYALLATPIWLTAWMTHKSELTMQYGDYRPIGSLFAYIALFVVSVLGIALGASLLRGAKHKGSWNNLIEMIGKKEKK